MWQVHTQELDGGRVLKLQFCVGERCLSYQQVLEAWRQREGFRELFMQQIREAPFTALRWETPPLNSANLARDFECVLLDSPFLDVPANPRDFHDYLRDDMEIVDFPNLAGDAQLVVPCPRSASANYSHLAGFHRSAPLQQQHALWRALADCVARRLSAAPLWLNTAGGGVDWLHVRLDSRPKYYGYQPYRGCTG
ncbi:MAG: hypothetical protein O7F73_15880 [Gammaproteobacteria bacterium]|nr:hypothetical protein [Gammaproteobacteria bacterium]